MLDIRTLLGDLGVPYWTSGKNVSEGWSSVTCPMCGDRSNHGAFSPEGDAYSCFRCGKHSVRKIISNFSSWNEAGILIQEYTSSLSFYEKAERERSSIVEWPPSCAVSMPSVHSEYLYKRGYDPKQLRELYGVESCYQTGDFKYRLVIPVYLDGKVVTYIGRDITGKASLPYKNLAERKSILPAKECVYNIDNIHETAIICEGVFDAWRFGAHGVATFGLQFTNAQTNALAKRLKRAFIVFDADVQAQAKGHELGGILAFQGVDVEVVSVSDYKDPGELPQSVADEIKLELFE